ncbi:MAG TPA: ABC transporter substrate-binding protein [Spirochaetales bacterium]|nr:ABC transporter substrate-binding protein [Spirochaetales bacterium]
MKYNAQLSNEGKNTLNTSVFHYPLRTINKLEISIGRVIAVQKNFAHELQSISSRINEELDITHDAQTKLQNIKPYLTSFSDHIRRIIKNMEAVSKIIETSREGFNISIANTRGAMAAIRECSNRMKNVYEITESITKRITVIAEFAVENKLIAINASVTASKAGEKVRGFKVIASEVSRLSATMAEKVTNVIEDAQRIRDYTSTMLSDLQQNIEIAQHTLDDVDKAFNTLDAIKTTIREQMRETAGMVQDKTKLEETLAVFLEILTELDKQIMMLNQKIHDCTNTNSKQNYYISNLLEYLPQSKNMAESLIKAYKNVDTTHKVLRMYELPIIEYDPALAQLVREFHYTHFTCVRLVRYSTDRKIVPYLADSWSLDPDGVTWHFFIKQDAKFFDGSPITTDDIQYTFERLINPVLHSPYSNMLNMLVGFEDFYSGKDEHLAGLRIIDDHAFDFILKRPCNFFLSLLTNGFCSILKRNDLYYGKKFPRDQIVSSGPFCSVPGKTGDVDVLAANPYFINGQALVDAIEIHRTSESIVDDLISGKIDFAYGLQAALEEDLRDKGFRGEIRHYTSRYCYGIVVNFQHENALTQFKDVRRAFAQAIDKDGIIEDIFGKDVVIATTPLSDAILNLKNDPLPYNPEFAKQVFKKYGEEGYFKEPLTLAYVDSSINYGASELLNRLKDLFAGYNVPIEIIKLSADDARPDVYKKYDLVFLRFMPELDFYAALEPFINPHGGDNYFSYTNEMLYQKLQNSIGIKDADKRRLYFEDLLEQFTGDVFMVPLFFRRVLAAIPNYLREVFLTPEEAFVPDVVYFDEFLRNKALQCNKKDVINDFIFKINEVLAVNEKIKSVGKSLELIASDILKQISFQKKVTSKAEFVLINFTDNVEKLKSANNKTIEAIHIMTDNTEAISSNAQFIQKSLEGFLQELVSMIQSVQNIKKDIKGVYNIVKLIEEANATIKSVAVNASIIANKSDDSSQELKKVSQDISMLVEKNAQEIAIIIKELQGLDESMKTELNELFSAHDEIEAAIHDIKDHTLNLKGLKPVLDSVHVYTENLEKINTDLFTRADLANAAVDAINNSAEVLQNSAESLHFGLALETAVIEIIDDITIMLSTISKLYLTKSACD